MWCTYINSTRPLLHVFVIDISNGAPETEVHWRLPIVGFQWVWSQRTLLLSVDESAVFRLFRLWGKTAQFRLNHVMSVL